MKKVTCISYHATGSGAVDDFLREFSDVKFGPSEVECRFLQDPDGIADLEYNLVENWHRLNNGYAIKRYLRFVKYYNHTYSLIFGDRWKRCSSDYINKLISFKYPGYWHADVRLLPFMKRAFYIFRRGISKIVPKKYKRTTAYTYFKHLENYHSHLTKSQFYSITQEYCEELCKSLSEKDSGYVVLDQCVSTTNIKRYLNYINDLKVIIVDRDPRDIYIQSTSANNHVLPHDPVLFSKLFLDMRLSEKEEIKNPNVLKVQFEDLIYKYEETTNKIIKFLNLNIEDHVQKKKYFNPAISIKNTQLWKKNNEYSKELNIIKNYLSNYFYQFPTEKNGDVDIS